MALADNGKKKNKKNKRVSERFISEFSAGTVVFVLQCCT